MKKTIKKYKASILALGLGISFWSFTQSDTYFQIAKQLDIFTSIYEEVNISYVDEVPVGEMMKTGIDAMLKSLDPYTVYYPESNLEDFKMMTTGEYGGIGAIISSKDGKVMIAEPYEGFPAAKSGLKAGDEIISINGQSTKDKTSSDISEILKGQPGKSLQIEVKRIHHLTPLKFEVIRAEVHIPEVPYYGMLPNNVGYIKLTSFTETASSSVAKALYELDSLNQLEGLVLDLRGNGGGLLREAVNIVNLFVPKNQLVVETKGKLAQSAIQYRTKNEPFSLTLPVIVYVDGGSASASEIVAGTLQDLDRAVVIGEESFGKGLVQQTRNMPYNTMIKLTVAKYYTPSGRCIQRLDYGHKNKDGKAEEVPDSLITEFSTKNGRKVVDGKGIQPDVDVSLEELSEVGRALILNHMIFNYATEYASEHEQIASAETYKMSNEEYNQFVAWVDKQGLEYTTQTEKVLDKLVKVAENEGYSEELNNEMDMVKDQIAKSKAADFQTFQYQIQELLENEIISRYYYQKGRIVYGLENDPYVHVSDSLFTTQGSFDTILK